MPPTSPLQVSTALRREPARSQAERVADVLRTRVTEGLLAPGHRMSEERLVAQLGVSRNTLREAFRLLAHDGLLVHRFNRGVFVAELGIDDLVDLYAVRKLVEPHVIGGLSLGDTARMGPLGAAVETAEKAAREEHWLLVGTANITFHRSLVALGDSPRMSSMVERLWAELRLLFSVVDLPRELYQPYVPRNRHLYEALVAGRFEHAATYLYDYLEDSEAALRRAFERRAG